MEYVIKFKRPPSGFDEIRHFASRFTNNQIINIASP